jgi:Protein of unknown function (DUF2933)
MELGTLLFLLLVLACPLMMVWMMRGHADHGGHASHGSGHGHTPGLADESPGTGSLDELRRRRADLDAEIAKLEQAETETKTPAAV